MLDPESGDWGSRRIEFGVFGTPTAALRNATAGLYSCPFAGVVELADTRDSKSRGINFPCGFKSHLRYLLRKDLRQIDVSPFFVSVGLGHLKENLT